MSLRLASALILVGLIALVVFLLTAQIGQGDTAVLLLGAALTVLGLLIRRRTLRRMQRLSRGRFRLLRRLRGEADETEDL